MNIRFGVCWVLRDNTTLVVFCIQILWCVMEEGFWPPKTNKADAGLATRHKSAFNKILQTPLHIIFRLPGPFILFLREASPMNEMEEQNKPAYSVLMCYTGYYTLVRMQKAGQNFFFFLCTFQVLSLKSFWLSLMS